MSGPQHAVPSEPATPEFWRAEQTPDPHWAAPGGVADWPPPARPTERTSTERTSTERTSTERRRSRLLIVAVPVLALALIVGVVAALGGFGKRSDRLVSVSPGQVITTGLIEYSFDKATSVQKESLGKQIHEVIVYGHARTTDQNSTRPSSTQFAGRDDVDKTVANPEIVAVGTAEKYATGSSLTPGLPPVDFRVEFEFPASWTPSSTFRLGVTDLKFQKLFFGGEDPHYEPDASLIYQVRVPVQVLPAEK